MKKLRLFLPFLTSCLCYAASLIDPSFNPGSGTDSFAETVLPMADGHLMICGNFTKYDGTSRAYIARLNEDGSLDTSFNARPAYWVRHMAIQKDGKVVIAGFFTVVETSTRNLIARLNPDGSLDSTFDPGLGAQEKLVPADPNDPCIFWVALQGDGKILITGSFAKYNGETAHGIARLNPDGSLDKTFQMGAGLDSWGRSILVQPNGQILVSGWMTSYDNHGYNRIVRLNSDGTPDPLFQPFFGDKTAIYTMSLFADGRMIVAGHSKNDQGLFTREIARLTPDGKQDDTFLGTSNEKTESLFVQPDGKIVAGGYFSEADGLPRNGIARWNPDGSIDPGFQANFDNFVWTVAPDSKGRVLVAGGFFTVDGVSRNGIVRLLPGTDTPIPPSPPRLTNCGYVGSTFSLSFNTEANRTYTLQSKDSAAQIAWTDLTSAPGTGGRITLSNGSGRTKLPARFYRVKVQ